MTERNGNPAVHLDANPFICLIEGSDGIASMLRDLFDFFQSRPSMAATSRLTLAEVLPKVPSPAHRRSYLDLIVWSGVIKLVPVARNVLIETSNYRSVTSSPQMPMTKLPDAIHAVTAIRSSCRFVMSNDGRLRLPNDIRDFTTTPDSITALMKELA